MHLTANALCYQPTAGSGRCVKDELVRPRYSVVSTYAYYYVKLATQHLVDSNQAGP